MSESPGEVTAEDPPPSPPQLFRIDEDGQMHLLQRPEEGWTHATKILRAANDEHAALLQRRIANKEHAAFYGPGSAEQLTLSAEQLMCCSDGGEAESQPQTVAAEDVFDDREANEISAALRTVVAPPGEVGLLFGTHADGHACIYEVKSGSPLAGKVGIGDVVIKVNGEDTAKHTHEELVTYLATKSEDTKTLRLRAPLRMVNAPPGPLGVVFAEHADGHGYIVEVKTDSPLRHALSVGDVIVVIDGQDTSALSHEEIVRRVDEKRDVAKLLLVRCCLASAHGAVGEELPSSAFASITAPPGKLGVVFETHADGHATVAELKPESTVAAAGFAVGDVVVAVDGEDTSKHPPAALVRLLSEKEGQVKVLTVRHTTPTPTPTRQKQIVV